MYSDAEVAALYDVLNPWDGARYASDAFYADLVMATDAVLDVGCGTGSMLHQARALGHAGRLVGIDPDPAMLDRARRRTDIEWALGVAAAAGWDREFDLATMTGHAFQCLVGDEEVQASLAAIRAALVDGGRFVFETRHPAARAWEGWSPDNATDVEDPAGRTLRVTHRVESVLEDVVTLTETTSDVDGTPLRVDRASLRFLNVPTLRKYLTEAGFAIEAQYGDWRRGPVTDDSTEIITIARRGLTPPARTHGPRRAERRVRGNCLGRAVASSTTRRGEEVDLTAHLPVERRERVEARLRGNFMAWLTTVRPDGQPISVPVWFLLRGDGTILVYSQPGKAKLRNIAANPKVSLTLDVTDIGRDVVRIEGTALAAGDELAASEQPAYVTKYIERIGVLFGTPERFAEEFSTALVITPTRLWA